MCQLCKLKTISRRARWPNPLSPFVDELVDLVRTAHADATRLATRKGDCIGEAAAIEKLASLRIASDSSDSRRSDPSNLPPTDAKATLDDSVSEATLNVGKSKKNTQPSESESATLKFTKAQASMATSLELLTTAMDLIEAERKEWWLSDAKKKQRQQWGEEGNTQILARQQTVNNACVDMISEMEAVIGSFKRWVMA